MENTPYLYETLVRGLSQHANGLDLRHLKTLAWMMVGLIHSYSMSLGAWTPFVISRAQSSQRTVRRLRRWLANDQIEVQTLYGPLIQQALGGGLANGSLWPWIPPCCGTRTASCACP
jgi:hypothetical protein